MKKRTKAENAAHSKAQREKKHKDRVSPAAVSPVSPAADRITLPADVPCPECVRLRAENSKLLARLLEQAKPPAVKVSADEAEALRQRVIATKINRINSFGNGHAIGTARI